MLGCYYIFMFVIFVHLGTGDFDCGPDSYKCNNQTKCVPQHWICDGDEDCDDGGDERLPQCGKWTKVLLIVLVLLFE